MNKEVGVYSIGIEIGAIIFMNCSVHIMRVQKLHLIRLGAHDFLTRKQPLRLRVNARTE